MRVIIVGAGPSGLMTAIKLKEHHHDVLLIEKNEKVGKKIYITGKGRCNVTNNCSNEEFLNNVTRNNKFLYSAINNFSTKDTMDFFIDNGVPLVSERGKRVFPSSYKASDISNCLLKVNKKLGTQILLNETVISIKKSDDCFIVSTNKDTYTADKVVIATGGKSYPATGSTGDGYLFAKHFNHTITDLVPGLVALTFKESIPSCLNGFTMKNVALNVNGPKTKISEFGDITFYKEGIAGPVGFTVSSLINRLNPSDLSVTIDFKPALDKQTLDNRILREIASKKSNNVKELLQKLLPGEIIDFFVTNSSIDPNLPLLDLKKGNRLAVVNALKSFKLTYRGLDKIERAVVTSGGVSTKEINPNTMESKIVPGLYFVGEVIDVDAFTGGFNLQIAFSTGALCGFKI